MKKKIFDLLMEIKAEVIRSMQPLNRRIVSAITQDIQEKQETVALTYERVCAS